MAHSGTTMSDAVNAWTALLCIVAFALLIAIVFLLRRRRRAKTERDLCVVQGSPQIPRRADGDSSDENGNQHMRKGIADSHENGRVACIAEKPSGESADALEQMHSDSRSGRSTKQTRGPCATDNSISGDSPDQSVDDAGQRDRPTQAVTSAQLRLSGDTTPSSIAASSSLLSVSDQQESTAEKHARGSDQPRENSVHTSSARLIDQQQSDASLKRRSAEARAPGRRATPARIPRQTVDPAAAGQAKVHAERGPIMPLRAKEGSDTPVSTDCQRERRAGIGAGSVGQPGVSVSRVDELVVGMEDAAETPSGGTALQNVTEVMASTSQVSLVESSSPATKKDEESSARGWTSAVTHVREETEIVEETTVTREDGDGRRVDVQKILRSEVSTTDQVLEVGDERGDVSSLINEVGSLASVDDQTVEETEVRNEEEFPDEARDKSKDQKGDEDYQFPEVPSISEELQPLPNAKDLRGDSATEVLPTAATSRSENKTTMTDSRNMVCDKHSMSFGVGLDKVGSLCDHCSDTVFPYVVMLQNVLNTLMSSVLGGTLPELSNRQCLWCLRESLKSRGTSGTMAAHHKSEDPGTCRECSREQDRHQEQSYHEHHHPHHRHQHPHHDHLGGTDQLQHSEKQAWCPQCASSQPSSHHAESQQPHEHCPQCQQGDQWTGEKEQQRHHDHDHHQPGHHHQHQHPHEDQSGPSMLHVGKPCEHANQMPERLPPTDSSSQDQWESDWTQSQDTSASEDKLLSRWHSGGQRGDHRSEARRRASVGDRPKHLTDDGRRRSWASGSRERPSDFVAAPGSLATTPTLPSDPGRRARQALSRSLSTDKLFNYVQESLPPPEDPEEEREAYVTIATNNSTALGCLVLGNSLRLSRTTRTLVVLITDGVSGPMRHLLSSVFHSVLSVRSLDALGTTKLSLLEQPDLGVSFMKLHIWRLAQFTKCVFLDSAALVIKNSDELFDYDELSAVPDIGWPDCFNTNVFVFRPSMETFWSLISFAESKGSFDGGDHGLLNMYFRNWVGDMSKRLPFIYNLAANVSYTYTPAFRQFGRNVKIVHFLGHYKPWNVPFHAATCQMSPSASVHPTFAQFVQYWLDIFGKRVFQLFSDVIQCHAYSQKYVTAQELLVFLPTPTVPDSVEALPTPPSFRRYPEQEIDLTPAPLESRQRKMSAMNQEAVPLSNGEHKEPEGQPEAADAVKRATEEAAVSTSSVDSHPEPKTESAKGAADQSTRTGDSTDTSAVAEPAKAEPYKKKTDIPGSDMDDFRGMAAWEQGHADYLGQDSSDNILKRLNFLISKPHSAAK